MITYLFASLFLAVLGLAAVVTVMAVAVPRARHRRELTHRAGTLSSAQELEDYIGKVDQALSGDELSHLDKERGDG